MAARNVIHWHKIKNMRDSFAVVIATAGGAGLMPRAPGTMGTLVAVPIAFLSSDWPMPARLLLWGTLLFAGTWASKKLDELMGTGDNQCIVMDEVVGLGITSWTLIGVTDPLPWIAAFLIFRFFDILKPFPVRNVDRWSKKKSEENSPLARWWGGFGVMADDVLAGFQGLAVMIVLQRLNVFPN